MYRRRKSYDCEYDYDDWDPQEERRCRARSQNILLLSLQDLDDQIIAEVLGTTGSIYNVAFTERKCTCSCPDFCRRRTQCKHIFFVVEVVLGLKTAMPTLTDIRTAAASVDGADSKDKRVPGAILQQFKKALEGIDDAERRDMDEDCAICFGSMKDTKCVVCPQCRHAVHHACMSLWKSTKGVPHNQCPYCRFQFK